MKSYIFINVLVFFFLLLWYVYFTENILYYREYLSILNTAEFCGFWENWTMRKLMKKSLFHKSSRKHPRRRAFKKSQKIKKESLVERENSRFKRGIEPNVAGVENETTRQLDNVFPRFLFLHDNTVSWSTFKSIRNLCSLTSSKAVHGAEGGKGHRRVTSCYFALTPM